MDPTIPLEGHGLFSAAYGHAVRGHEGPAIIDVGAGRTLTYADLLTGAAVVRHIITDVLAAVDGDIQEQRIAFLVPPGADYVHIQWGIWAAGGVAVPLCTTHPFHELEYAVADSKPSLIFIHHDFAHHKSSFTSTFPSIKIVDVPLPHTPSALPQTPLPDPSPSRRALIIYTSGTTSKPKGCVSTHANILFQAASLVKAWHYTPSDHLIHILPLHHVHGIINGLTATLLAGGTVELHPKFDASAVWKRWMDGDTTLFMAVPTVYARLNTYFTTHIAGTDAEQAAIHGARKLRLVVSGSAALPTSVKTRFREITGQVLLERYGMTEVGMALSCRYDDTDGNGRPDGSVGWPLDGVDVRLASDTGETIHDDDTEGEIQISGANVFKERHSKRIHKRQLLQNRRYSVPPPRRRILHPRPQFSRHHQVWRVQNLRVRSRARNPLKHSKHQRSSCSRDPRRRMGGTSGGGDRDGWKGDVGEGI
ncbi:hypothetical protein TWF696_001398 [Orbilia brochopaga]|uniref:AMP-dependent synthetase/ligase domain-containing protein n=1 Tax=Orbilia brochopaga TaxID=3140254 RepID=A0AAV9UA78_9PEZI